MGKYRTAQGKIIDMSQIAAKNEHVRAVGNMSVNARGDTIDSHGNIVVPVTKKVGKSYQQSVSNRAANIVKKKPKIDETGPVENTVIVEPVVEAEEVTIDPAELLDEELELEDDEDALEIEALKAAEFTIKPASEAPDFYDPKSETKTKK